MRYKYFLIFFIILIIKPKIILSISTIDDYAIDIIKVISNTTILKKFNENISNKTAEYIFNIKRKYIIDHFDFVWKKLGKSNTNFYGINSPIEISLSKHQELDNQLNEIDGYNTRIDFLYDNSKQWYKHLKKNMSINEDLSMTDIISLSTSSPQTIMLQLFRKFSSNVYKPHRINFLNEFYKILESNDKIICEQKISSQRQLYLLYNRIIYMEVKGFITLAFSYVWKAINTNLEYLTDLEDVANDTIDRINEYSSLFKYKIKNIVNFIRRCDPKKQEKDKTYASFDNFIYAFVTNQKTFEPKNKEKCEKFCGDIITNTSECEEKKNCKKYDTICQGKITGCKNHGSYEVCQRQKNDNSSTRHYHWFKNKNNNIYYGNVNQGCTATTSVEATNIITWLPSLFSKTCHTCICQCVDDRTDTDNKTIRAISYLWSNTSDDMIATGARLVAQDRMIHIQLREAKLLPFGKINETSERWIPLPKFKYQNQFPYKAIYPDGSKHLLIPNKDFKTIKINLSDKICLQKFIFNEKYLLTGARFNSMYFNNSKKDEESCFNIDTNYAEFKYDTGEIMNKKFYDKQQTQLSELILNEPDNPLKFKTNVQDSMDNQFVRIGVSDLIKDASQTTIPLIDIQDVTTKSSVPISGIELFHKGQVDGTSGGYVALKIHPIDFSLFINGNDSYIDLYESQKQDLY